MKEIRDLSEVLYTGAYSGFWKGGCGREAPEKFFTQPGAKLLCTHPFRIHPLFASLPYWTLLGVSLGWRDVKRQFFLHPLLRMGAKIQGECETKGRCNGPKRPALNTPSYAFILCRMVSSPLFLFRFGGFMDSDRMVLSCPKPELASKLMNVTTPFHLYTWIRHLHIFVVYFNKYP